MPQLHNPKAYRVRSTPIPLPQARDNSSAFMKDVIDLMTKYHIADCLVVAEACVEVPARDLTEEDSEAFVTLVCHIGDQNKSVPMAAYGHAYMRAEFDSMVNRRKASGEKDGAR